MAVFRFLAAVCLLVAAIALVVDATPFIYGTGPFAATAVSTHWLDLAPSSYQAAHKAVAGMSEWLWSGLVSPLLSLPTSMMFGLLALLFGYAGRHRRRVRIFVN